MQPDSIIHNAKIATNGVPSFVESVAIKDGKISAIGRSDEILQGGAATNLIDCGGRTVIPGLNDSHMHPIRGGLNYNIELRWNGVSSLADAQRMLKEQAARTPAPQWVRVVGGWTEFQFAERRMPTLDEINAVAGDTPVFVLHCTIVHSSTARRCARLATRERRPRRFRSFATSSTNLQVTRLWPPSSISIGNRAEPSNC